MKVLLINPTTHFEAVGNNPVVLESNRGLNPPLGILHLAGEILDKTDFAVEILDAHAEALSWKEIGFRIEHFSPDVVGLTVMTQTLVDVLRIVEITMIKAPQARVVLGGPHVHLFPEETINLPGVDYLVLGEGERSFTELLMRLDKGAAFDDIPGLVFKRESRIVHTGFPEMLTDLNGIAFPARQLTDVSRYHSVLMPRRPATTMFTSRGCPYQCSFCDRPHLGKKFRARSAASVLAEFEACKRLGIRDFLIYDDTFTIRRERVMEICQAVIAGGLDIHFDIRARVDTVDEEILWMLKKAGCQGIHYGVEAGTEKILKVLRKGISLDQVERVFAETRRIGIKTLAYFMIGSPTETLADIKSTFHFARKLKPDYLHLTILTPFPGTEIYKNALESRIIKTDVWREFAQNPHLGFAPPYWSENFSREELNELLVEGYRDFYRRPAYLIRRILEVRSFEELKRKAEAGIRFFFMRDK